MPATRVGSGQPGARASAGQLSDGSEWPGGRTSRAASRVLPTINVGEGSAESFVTATTIAAPAADEEGEDPQPRVDAPDSGAAQAPAQTAVDRVTGALDDDEGTV